MIKNKSSNLSFSISLVVAIFSHLVILFFVKKNSLDYKNITANALKNSHPIKIDRIELIEPKELERIKRVGIKNGMKKDYFQPDLLPPPKPIAPTQKGLSLGNLASPILIPKEKIAKQESSPNISKKNKLAPTPSSLSSSSESKEESGHFYFNPKKEKQISRDNDQDSLKQEAYKNLPSSSSNPVAQKISNFEIRYERPEGISEDELNSDEKAYYSFFKRSYASYLTKLYASFEKISVERPGLEKAFSNKHLLIGRIDYDDMGNIIMVKILKSSESDDVHYFFEETLKQLNLPNPPKSFIKNKKQFSTYYQIQIN